MGLNDATNDEQKEVEHYEPENCLGPMDIQ